MSPVTRLPEHKRAPGLEAQGAGHRAPQPVASTLYIAEYINVHPGGLPIDPPIAEQTVPIEATSTQSAPFNHNTKVIRLHCDDACCILIGSDPKATATNARMGAGQTEWRGVPPGQAYKIAVIRA
jgi:hypothetical protein